MVHGSERVRCGQRGWDNGICAKIKITKRTQVSGGFGFGRLLISNDLRKVSVGFLYTRRMKTKPSLEGNGSWRMVDGGPVRRNEAKFRRGKESGAGSQQRMLLGQALRLRSGRVARGRMRWDSARYMETCGGQQSAGQPAARSSCVAAFLSVECRKRGLRLDEHVA
jgi:hypothetical protein